MSEKIGETVPNGNNSPISSDIVKNIIGNNGAESKERAIEPEAPEVNLEQREELDNTKPPVQALDNPNPPAVEKQESELETKPGEDVTEKIVLDTMNQLKGNGFGEETLKVFNNVINQLKESFDKTYQGKEKDLERRFKKVENQYQEMIEQEKKRNMTESERIEYEKQLKIIGYENQIKVLTQRVKELEEERVKTENKAFIEKMKSEHPEAKATIERLGIETEEDYTKFIVPQLPQLAEYAQLVNSNNRYGSGNAFGGYQSKSNDRQDISDSIKKKAVDLAKSWIRK